MFSVIFPGQGSQLIGMGKEFFDKYDFVALLLQRCSYSFTAANYL